MIMNSPVKRVVCVVILSDLASKSRFVFVYMFTQIPFATCLYTIINTSDISQDTRKSK